MAKGQIDGYESLQIFKSSRELATYTRSTAKYFPREHAKAGGLLKYLLRHIFSSGEDDSRMPRGGFGGGNDSNPTFTHPSKRRYDEVTEGSSRGVLQPSKAIRSTYAVTAPAAARALTGIGSVNGTLASSSSLAGEKSSSSASSRAGIQKVGEPQLQKAPPSLADPSYQFTFKSTSTSSHSGRQLVLQKSPKSENDAPAAAATEAKARLQPIRIPSSRLSSEEASSPALSNGPAAEATIPSSPPPSSPLPLDMPSSPAPEAILPTKELKASTKSAALEMPTPSQFPLPAAKGSFGLLILLLIIPSLTRGTSGLRKCWCHDPTPPSSPRRRTSGLPA